MRTLFLALALISSATADDRLNDLEQFREALGTTLGKKDLKLPWPLRLVIFKKQPPVPGNTIALATPTWPASAHLPLRNAL